MSNEHLREKEMSLKAKGLLSLMLSLPDDWEYSISGLCALCKESESAIKAAISELKSFGYLCITMKKPNETESKKIEYEYVIFESPKKEEAEGEVQNEKVEFAPKSEKKKNGKKPKKMKRKSKPKCGKLSFLQEREKQSTEKQGTENQSAEKHGLLNTKEQITEIQNTELPITKKENQVKEKRKSGNVENSSLSFEGISIAEMQKIVGRYIG